MNANKIAPGDFLRSILLVLKASIKSFGANRNLESAATLGFYGFLSLMPMLLLSIIILRNVLESSEQAAAGLARVLEDIFPAFNLNILDDLAAMSGGGALSLIGMILLAWSMTPLSGALRTALARMFVMPIQRPLIISTLLDIAAVLGFLVLFFALVFIKLFTGILPFALHAALPFVLTVMFIGLFFRVFSPVRLSWRQWLLGAVCVTLLWAIMRNVFVIFLQYNPDYGYAFGSLKAIFLLIVWVYYSFAALLFGAEIMANTYRRDALLLKGLLQPAERGGESGLLKKFERMLEDGAVLFREGDAGREMFVILDGKVRITRGGRDLITLGPGQYFGEMSLLNGAPRSATATAAGPARLAEITQNNFDLLVRENPVLVRGLLEELARRLAETNRRMATGK